MTIAWNQFTPWASLAGGMMIGAAASAFILLNGRILGVSGILGGLLRREHREAASRLAFIAGVLVAPLAWGFFSAPVRPHIDASWAVVVIGGLLVGIGTRFASGCTSGHGVCGLASLSPRSLAATLVFMAAGIATVALTHHAFA